MLKALIKARFASMFSSMFRGNRGKKKRGPLIKILSGVLAVYVIAQFLVMFGFMFDAILPPLLQANLGWLYFALVGIMAFGFIFVGSVLMTQSTLYEAKDNEMLLSMPIPPRMILISRMLTLLGVNFVFEVLICIPAAVVYAMHAPVTFIGSVYFVIAFLFLPLMAMALSSLFGWLLALISSRVRVKTLLVTAMSIVFLLAYFYVFSSLSDYLNYLIANGAQIASAVQRALFPAYHLGLAVAQGNTGSLLIFILCAVVPFGLVYLVLSANFIRIVTARPGAARAKYREKPLKVSGAVTALVRKELKHFFSSPMYILNASMGVIFTCILPIALLFNRDLLAVLFADEFPGIAGLTGPFVLLVLCGIATTNIISAPSISLEGKNLWIAQSIPVKASDVLMSKAFTHMTVCLPSVLFAGVMLNLILDINPLTRVLLFLTPAALTVFQAMFGVAVNLRFPKFDWISEMIAVKQGASTLIAMFGSMALVALPTILYASILSSLIRPEIYIALVTVLIAGLAAGLNVFLKTKGGKMFSALSA